MRIRDWSSDVCSSDLMRTPIAVTLAWPGRMATPANRLDLAAIARLTFEVPDFARFPALNLARQALQTGGAAPTILNAANEVVVAAFLKGQIGFLDFTRIVEKTLARVQHGSLPGGLEARRVGNAGVSTATSEWSA